MSSLWNNPEFLALYNREEIHIDTLTQATGEMGIPAEDFLKPELVGSFSTTVSTSATITLDMPFAAAKGDLALIIVEWDGSNSPILGGWQQLVSQTTPKKYKVWYKLLTATEDVTVTAPGTNTTMNGAILVYRNVDKWAPILASGTQSGSLTDDSFVVGPTPDYLNTTAWSIFFGLEDDLDDSNIDASGTLVESESTFQVIERDVQATQTLSEFQEAQLYDYLGFDTSWTGIGGSFYFSQYLLWKTPGEPNASLHDYVEIGAVSNTFFIGTVADPELTVDRPSSINIVYKYTATPTTPTELKLYCRDTLIHTESLTGGTDWVDLTITLDNADESNIVDYGALSVVLDSTGMGGSTKFHLDYFRFIAYRPEDPNAQQEVRCFHWSENFWDTDAVVGADKKYKALWDNDDATYIDYTPPLASTDSDRYYIGRFENPGTNEGWKIIVRMDNPNTYSTANRFVIGNWSYELPQTSGIETVEFEIPPDKINGLAWSYSTYAGTPHIGYFYLTAPTASHVKIYDMKLSVPTPKTGTGSITFNRTVSDAFDYIASYVVLNPEQIPNVADDYDTEWHYRGEADEDNANNWDLDGGTLVVTDNGFVQKSLDFDGATIVETSRYPEIFSTPDFCFGLWIKTNTLNNCFIYGPGDNLDPTTALGAFPAIWMEAGGILRFQIPTRGGPPSYLHVNNVLTTSISAGQWTHYVITGRNENSVELYKNGTLVTSVELTDELVVSNFYTHIGGSTTYGYFNGQIDEFFYQDRYLDDSDVLTLYNHESGATLEIVNEATPYCLSSNVQEYWDFNTDDGTGVFGYPASDYSLSGGSNKQILRDLWSDTDCGVGTGFSKATALSETISLPADGVGFCFKVGPYSQSMLLCLDDSPTTTIEETVRILEVAETLRVDYIYDPLASLPVLSIQVYNPNTTGWYGVTTAGVLTAWVYVFIRSDGSVLYYIRDLSSPGTPTISTFTPTYAVETLGTSKTVELLESQISDPTLGTTSKGSSEIYFDEFVVLNERLEENELQDLINASGAYPTYLDFAGLCYNIQNFVVDDQEVTMEGDGVDWAVAFTPKSSEVSLETYGVLLTQIYSFEVDDTEVTMEGDPIVLPELNFELDDQESILDTRGVAYVLELREISMQIVVGANVNLQVNS